MPKQDFFALCTSLKPIELKAIGALSRVEHLPAGTTIYETGQPGDLLYIINRGVVEVLDDGMARPGSATYLSRGDVLGEVEALTEQPRRQTARSCEAVSLQIFRREDFTELLARVPTFFRFLCNELARRLAEPRALATAATGDQALELSGSLANFDLVTIYQTIVNSSQTGQLSIRDAGGQVISTFRFERGQPRCGTFDHLSGEEAFWQLFLTEGMAGTFSFSSGAGAEIQQPLDGQITRAAGEMLIHALQGRDEFQMLRAEFNPASMLERGKPHLAPGDMTSPTLRPLVEQIWRQADKRRVALQSLYPRFEVCELKIYQTVAALVRSGHFVLSSDALADKVA